MQRLKIVSVQNNKDIKYLSDDVRDSLFLTSSELSKKSFKKLIDKTVKAILAAFDSGVAYDGLTPEELKKACKVRNILPENGIGLDKITKQLSKKILPGFLRPSSTNYMAHLHSPALMETIASELVIAAFNQSMDSWDQSPVATEIELQVIKELCKLYGYSSNADGVFTSGGSQSNFCGLTMARDWFCNKKLNHDVKKHGLPANYNKLRIYTSEISHFSMEKSSHLLGLGYDAVVKVPVDKRCKMDITSLKTLIESDVKNGNIPMCVVATIGTTDYGSIDPVDEIKPLCKEYGMWLHADAAYGSGVIMSDKYSSKVANLKLCDSITVDFHKMFLLPISCSAILAKDASDFDTFTIHADYLNREEDEEDGYTNLVGKSVQTTRRFDALKVWTSFQVQGKEGFSNIITTCIENASYLYNVLKNDSRFEVVTEPEISSVVFRVNTDCETNKKIRRALIHEHGVVIGQTVYNSKTYLKFTLLNPLITHEKLDELLVLILKLAKN